MRHHSPELQMLNLLISIARKVGVDEDTLLKDIGEK